MGSLVKVREGGYRPPSTKDDEKNKTSRLVYTPSESNIKVKYTSKDKGSTGLLDKATGNGYVSTAALRDNVLPKGQNAASVTASILKSIPGYTNLRATTTDTSTLKPSEQKEQIREEILDNTKTLLMGYALSKITGKDASESETLKNAAENISSLGQKRDELISKYPYLEDPSFLQRVGNTISGAAKNTVGAFTNIGGVFSEKMEDTRQRDLSALRNQFSENAGDDEARKAIEELNKRDKETTKAYQTNADLFYQAADSISASGAEDLERAKQGAGKVGSAVVDIGAAGLQLAGDMGLAALTGGTGIAPMLVRSFGGSSMQARQEGADLDEQIGYGVASAAVSGLTEKVSNVAAPFKKIFGKGVADDLVEQAVQKAVTRFVSSEIGKTALGAGLRLGTSAVGEGFEEMLENFVNPALQLIYKSDNNKSAMENLRNSYGENFDLGDMLYDGMIGAALGLVGGIPGSVSGSRSNGSETEINQQTDVQQSDAAQAILEASGMQQTPVQTQTDTQTSTILDRAAAEYQQRGSVTNATATAILNDTAAVAQLEQNGLNLTDSMSQSQKRAAVKDAVARMETTSVSEQVPVDVLRATGNEAVAPDVLSSVFGDQENVQQNAAMNQETESVGAAEAGFNTAQFPGQEKTSRMADAFPYNQYQAEATGMKKEDYDRIFRYESQTEGKSQALAEELLYYLVDGKRTFLMDADMDAYNGIVDSLKSATAWNGPQTDAAYMIQRELQGRAVNGDIDETPYIDWLETMREHLTSGGQGVQANAKWTRADNVGGRASELEAWDNLDKSDLSYEEKKARFQEIVRYDQQIENITQGDTESMKNIILDVARNRGVLDRLVIPGESKILTGILNKSLNGLSFDQLKNLAYASTSAMSQDATPANIGQKIKTVQVLSMLSLPTTTMSNLAGNTTFYGLDVASMRGAALIDMALSKITGTRSTAFEKGMLSRASMESAVNALNQSIAEITLDVDMGNGESRYGTGSQRTFRANGNFLSRALSAAERNLNYALSATDQFYKGAAMSTESQIQDLIDQGKIKTTNDDYASDYAKNLAKYRTFQDKSLPSVFVQTVHDLLNLGILGVGDSGKRIGGFKVKSFGLGDVVAPFTKVAGNLVSRGLEYSPANAIKGSLEIVDTIAKSVRGDVDPARQAKAVSDFARGMTGTAVAYGIMQLVKAGLIKRADDESDEDVRALNASEGISGAQLNLGAAWRWINGEDTTWQEGDTLIDLSRLEPLNFLMNLGTELAKDNSDGIVSTIEGTANATTNAFLNAASELPVLQFIGNLATDTIKYGQPFSESLSEQAANTIVSSIIPNALRGTARALDDRPRNTYSSGTFLGNIRDSVLNSIPGLRETLPGSVDNYGNEKTYQGSDVAHFFDELFNPIGVNTYQQSDVSKELDSIREATGDTSYFPDKNAPSSIEHNKQTYKLTNDDKLEYQQIYGSLYEDTFRQAMETEAYQSMTPEEKAEFGNEIRSYADAAAKANYLNKSGVSYDNSDLDREAIAESGGATAADYLTLKTLYSMAVDGFEESGAKYSKKAETAKIIDQMDGLDTDAKATLWQAMNNDNDSDSDERTNPYSGTLAVAGVPTDDIIAIEEKYSQIHRSDADSKAQATEFSKWLDGQDFTPDQRALVEETYKYWGMYQQTPTPYDYKTMNKTQQMNYDDWGKDFGWTETAFIDAYNAASAAKETQEYKDTKSEARKDRIMKEALVAAGFTNEEASRFVRKFKW